MFWLSFDFECNFVLFSNENFDLYISMFDLSMFVWPRRKEGRPHLLPLIENNDFERGGLEARIKSTYHCFYTDFHVSISQLDGIVWLKDICFVGLETNQKGEVGHSRTKPQQLSKGHDSLSQNIINLMEISCEAVSSVCDSLLSLSCPLS